MIERSIRTDVALRTMQRHVVDAGGQISIVRIGLPFHGETEHVHIEALHGVEIARVQSKMPQAGVRRSLHL